MKDSRLASKTRQLTKGGSLPASRSASGRNGHAGWHQEEKTKPMNGRFADGVQTAAPEVPPVDASEEIPAETPSRFPIWKRALDVALVLLTMFLWLPLMLLTMALIKIVSPGPTFYRQPRIGFRGRPFIIFKFRTMKVNAETQTHENYVEKLMRSDTPLTKLDATDSRLIPCGRILRSTGLDELPQIFNVLLGDMSLVGPRPCTIREFGCYQPWQKARVNAPPGLTGYWQVNGKNKTTFDQMMRMDLHYARMMSLGLDVKIIAKTVPAIFEQTREALVRRMAPKAAQNLINVVPEQGYNGSVKHL